jgi:hypothetical protein
VQDTKANYTPGMGYSFSGGLRPSALGPNARQAGQNLSNAGLSLQTNPQLPNVPAMPNFPSTMPSGGERAANYGAIGTGLLSQFMPKQNFLQELLAQLAKQGQASQPPGGGTTGGGDVGTDWSQTGIG